MPTQHILQEYLKDLDNFKEAKRYWIELVNQIYLDSFSDRKWKEFFGKTTDRNGKEVIIVEPGPMVTLMDEEMHRAVVISQLEVEHQGVFVLGYLDVFGEGYLPVPIEFIDIKCEASIEAVEIIKRWITVWMNERTTYDDMAETVSREGLTG